MPEKKPQKKVLASLVLAPRVRVRSGVRAGVQIHGSDYNAAASADSGEGV
jgi:hypothetical protein